MALFEKLAAYKDFALLVLRAGTGSLLLTHGVPKLMHPEKWKGLGGSMDMFGIHFLPAFWGFMAAASEGIGGVLLIIGLFFRPAALLALITMGVAAYSHFSKGDGVSEAEKALLYGFILLSLFILGPGKYSVDKK